MRAKDAEWYGCILSLLETLGAKHHNFGDHSKDASWGLNIEKAALKAGSLKLNLIRPSKKLIFSTPPQGIQTQK